jgi:hypothetical protein
VQRGEKDSSDMQEVDVADPKTAVLVFPVDNKE